MQVLRFLTIIGAFGLLLQGAGGTELDGLALSEPAPYLADMKTGYLINCIFAFPIPYCWHAKTAILSGWETDLSGGTWQESPGPFFHVDWFKLIDTKSDAAVTIKHKIARQTGGVIALEFRFAMPKKMDGVAWQLCDLQEAGAGIVTAGGNLCYEMPDHRTTVLQSYDANRAYGVKIIADITAKTADIYIDGDLKAKAMPFCNPISTIDYVLIHTGREATGELYLDPVNLYKGYSVCETFVTCGVGKIPADWTVDSNSGPVSVQEIKSSTTPDIFSLKLEGSSGHAASVAKTFMPIGGKDVFDYRFMLPVVTNGAVAELDAEGKSEMKLVTSGGDICYINDQGQCAPLIHNYRSNFWYMMKVVVDSVACSADIYVNGKLVAQNARFVVRQAFNGQPVTADALRFSSPSTMWVDDVHVYRWQDYPADYVPTPKPAPAKAPYLLGVQSCNLWQEGQSCAGWDYPRLFAQRHKPYLGWYDEGNPEETDWEIKWQVEHGIGFEMHCWYRPDDAINYPIKDGVLDHGIIKGLFNARYSNLTKFAIMYTDQGAGETNLKDFHDNIVPYWIEYFFKDPRYLKIDGKPVLSIYSLDDLLRMLHGPEGCRQALDDLRAQCKQAGFPGVLVWMEDRTADLKTLQTMKTIGVDDCYAYTWYTADTNSQCDHNKAQRAAAATAGIGMLPSISVGWNKEAWGDPGGGWASIKDYRSLAEWTRDVFAPSLPKGSLGRHVIMLANWNEFGEGHYMLPSTLAGFGYIDALREVFTGAGPAGPDQDLVPTAEQKRRFNVLFPKD